MVSNRNHKQNSEFITTNKLNLYFLQQFDSRGNFQIWEVQVLQHLKSHVHFHEQASLVMMKLDQTNAGK